MRAPLLLSVLLAPYAALFAVGFAFTIGRGLIDTVWASDGLAAPYRDLVSDPTFRTVVLRTFETAAIVSTICLLLAYPTAEFLHRARPRLQPFLLVLVLVPLWTSVIARTYGWVGILQGHGLLDRVMGAFGLGSQRILYTWVAVIVGMVHVLLPILLVPVYVAVRRYDERLSSASYSAGAGTLRTLVYVKLPVLAPQLFAATIVIFVLALGFFVTPALLGGPTSTLVSTLIFQQITQVFNPEMAEAMSILLLIITLSTLAVLGGLLRLVRRAS